MHEAWTTKLVQELLRPGGVYLNAGANYGYYVALGARLVGDKSRVYAVESNPYITPYLLESLCCNGVAHNVRIFHVALSDSSGDQLSMHFDPQYLWGGHMANSCNQEIVYRKFEDSLWVNGVWAEGEEHEINVIAGNFVSYKCNVATIDCLVGDDCKLDLLHVDIEGAEPRALLDAK